ncbi:zinc-dependent metalloprotease [Aquimarina sp. 2201CG5-10]|uniref:zinc-dependent metalloprotease n=1 Tax=Aquimarina callyspongiae TaxID=3098150 RepID=UPI002AB4970B|nr:zinc-dependent metalloprotease [Aquimarina sp. 2201CG5-10]MDY8135528.1 zinc-dependent metalloprotease [Aquimarina sp. 2201CG5-10]
MKLHFVCLFFIVSNILTGQFLEEKKNLESYNGYFNFHYNKAKDEIYLEVDKLDAEFLYVHSLSSGLGSNDIGLDRGQIGDGVVVKFQRAGNKLLLIQPNQRYRAVTDNDLEKKSVEQAFAKSVLFGFPIKEEKSGKFIIDLTPFLLQDTHGIINRLKFQKEGAYSVDKSRSALSLDRTKAFPKNVEFEALITYKGSPSGGNIRSVAPDSKFLSVIQHHSFVELPDNNYIKREFDPRSGAISISYLDYATPVQESIMKRYIIRHRLEKKNPESAVSEAKEPIIYYLDPGTPEPVRSALLDGARWWNQAYEAIGFKNAFQVKILPANADPMDLRYNVIQWVHRSTRGWSYGASVVDPRTGEILKGHVSLGSLRIRQDFLIAQALLNQPFKERDDNYQPMLEMALARIRQLSAHEVGHTIGFAHNFAASTSERASVMDYPHPLVTLTNGKIDLSNAYDTKIGAWDKVTVAYSYSEFDKGTNEKEELNKILNKAYQSGMRFISDSDARPQGGAHALAHLWDNGKSATEGLKNVLSVREEGIRNFSADNIKSNEPYSVLEDVFVPLYFFHRYQTEATVKLIGGLNYNYAVKGDQQTIVETVAPKQQKEALQQILETLTPEILAIPEEKLKLFPPRAFGYWRSRESFKGKTGVGFDALSVASTASDMSLSLLLHPERASRLVQQKSLDKSQLGLAETLDELLKVTFKEETKSNYYKEINHTVKANVLKRLMSLSKNQNAYPQVNAIAYAKMVNLIPVLTSQSKDPLGKIYNDYYLKQIQEFMKRPESFKVIPSPKIPDGSPIGSDRCEF